MNESQDDSNPLKHPCSEALVSEIESSEAQKIESNAPKKSKRLQDKAQEQEKAASTSASNSNADAQGQVKVRAENQRKASTPAASSSSRELANKSSSKPKRISTEELQQWILQIQDDKFKAFSHQSEALFAAIMARLPVQIDSPDFAACLSESILDLSCDLPTRATLLETFYFASGLGKSTMPFLGVITEKLVSAAHAVSSKCSARLLCAGDFVRQPLWPLEVK